MKKSTWFFGLSLLWMLLLSGSLPAGAYGGVIRTEKEIQQTAREDGREFTLRYKVWAEDPLGPREPCRILTADEKDGPLPAQLERLAGTAEKSQAPVCLVILAGESPPPTTEESLAMQRSVQRVRDAGGRAYVCGGEGWQVLASAPREEHFFPPEQREACLEAVQRYASGAYLAEVTEALDPRFTLSQAERTRLEAAGAKVSISGKSWVITWPAEMPRTADEPWTASLTIEAKAAFPGGNGVETSTDGTGVFIEGSQAAEFRQTKANVGLSLRLQDASAKIFLGETVPVTLDGQPLEDKMLGAAPDWFGKAATGAFSFQWEGVGTIGQLNRAQPTETTQYRLRVAFTPTGTGAGAAGPPVARAEAEGLYHVTVLPGVLRIQITGENLTRHSTLALRVESKTVTRTVIARPEADPQGGALLLAAELTDLPYGKYTVTPGRAMDGTLLPPQECLLGVCKEDDTVSPARRFATVKFTL